MKIERFFAATSRQALGLVRDAIGPDAIILSNRNLSNGIEILASNEMDFNASIEAERNNLLKPTPTVALSLPTACGAPTGLQPAEILDEIKAMRSSLETRLTELAWTDQQNRFPVKSGMLRELIAKGFSASLSRFLTENTPADNDVEQGIAWAKSTLTRNLVVLENEAQMLDQGGIFALIGPTGVGKTTTTAKLAARYVFRHGADKLALITTDSYRIGAHEQLRIYGKILGVMVHSVRDEVDLSIALKELKHKHTVLIDTVGMSQRDQMVAAQIAMLSGTEQPIKRLLCLNATSTIETLNEVVRAYQGSGLAGCILTKLDEAVSTSNALDVILRHKLKLHFTGTGQRVPEDLTVADPKSLVNMAFDNLKSSTPTNFKADELPIVMSSQVVRQDQGSHQLHVS